MYDNVMASRATKPVTVTLGKLGEGVTARVAKGQYASVSEVVRAGLRALEREEAAFDELLRRKVEAALGDSRPMLTQEEVFTELRALHEAGHR